MWLLAGTAPARRMYVVAAAIGLATYLIVFGLGHLVGTNAYWAMPLFCGAFDHGRVCSTNAAAITAAIHAGILH